MLNNEIIVYQAPQGKQTIRLLNIKRKLKIASNLFLILSLLLLIFTLGSFFKTEINNNQPQINFGYLLKLSPSGPIITAPNPYFSLVIPKINVKTKVVANIDASNKKEYQLALNQGVAHAKGTVFPGMKGTIYLFAHSSNAPWNLGQNNTFFYPLYKLEDNDQIVVFFQNKKFNYKVADKKIVNSSEIDFFEQREKEVLVLQTCYPPGTDKKSLLVFAQRESD